MGTEFGGAPVHRVHSVVLLHHNRVVVGASQQVDVPVDVRVRGLLKILQTKTTDSVIGQMNCIKLSDPTSELGTKL